MWRIKGGIVLNYHECFVRDMYVYFFIYTIIIIFVLFNWFSKDFYNDFDNKKLILGCRVGITIFGIIAFFLLVVPFAKDKKAIETDDYCELYGIISHDVKKSGRGGAFKLITIGSEGKEYEFRISYIEEGLSLNDEVKVTYLENSRYAVIESRKK